MGRLTRRGLFHTTGCTTLAGLAAAVVGSEARAMETMPATDQPDAELIAIGHEATDLIEQRKPLEARWWAIPKPSSGRFSPAANLEAEAVSDALQPIDKRLEALSDRAIDLQAITHEGRAAKARLIRHEIRICNVTEGRLDLEEMAFVERMTWSLLAARCSLLADLLGAPI